MGQVLLVNRAAQAILDRNDGLRLTVGGVRAARSDESEALARLIAEAARTTEGQPSESAASAGGAIDISRPSFRRPVSVLVTPLHGQQYRLGAQPAAAALFVSDPEQTVESNEEVLRRLYQLTAAEAALAVQLLGGKSIGEAAETLCVTSGTARVQLKSIFCKTGVHRPAELMKLFLTGVAQVCWKDN